MSVPTSSAGPPATASPGKLEAKLGPWLVFGLGVGYVISGEYFGWNLGLPVGGTYGMAAATLAVTVMYVAFVLSYAELACALPGAGGAFVYAERGLGRTWGALAGFCQLVEFVLAPPAIALAIGAYVNLYVPNVSPVALAALAYVALTALNVYGVKQAAKFELFVTAIAVMELLVFIGVTAPAFRWENLHRNPLPNGWAGAFGALPFAIWFYLAIEGIANLGEEARDPARDLSRGFGAAMATLVALAIAVFVTAVGVAGWEAIVYAAPGAPPSDSPLPLAMAHAVSRASPLYAMLVGVGLFGLVASFHGILLAAGRATLALGRAHLLPSRLGVVSTRTGTPVPALLANMAVGLVALATGRTGDIITVSVLGALGLYIVSMAAFFALRRKEPNLARPFRAPGYPFVPLVALVLAVVCFAAVAWSSPGPAAAFIAIVAGAWTLGAITSPSTSEPG